jgi:hypothetical protein
VTDQGSRIPQRVWGTLGLGVLIVLSALLPGIYLVGSNAGRWLLPTANFFLGVNAYTVPSNDPAQVDLALNITYLGLAMNQGGVFLAVLTLWTLATNDMNRWLYRIVVILGWLLAISVPLVLNGWFLLARAGASVELGYAWAATLLAGIGTILACRRARDRVDGDWFAARPELQ